MKGMLKLQLNTATAYTRDMTVQLTNQATGEKKTVKPYLDGSVAVPNVDAGEWRVQVKHPNLVFDVYDRPVKVLPDRPTITPIVIPQNIFENVPIRDIPDADLGPVQQRLDEASSKADLQARKLAGQPIYADDWNDLATTLGTTAKSARELTELVSPRGHDHPELVEKIEELQRNLQKLFDTMGASLAQLQRQIQQLALTRKIDAALDRVPNLPPATRTELSTTAQRLVEAWNDSPGVYNALKRRVGQTLQDQLTTVLQSQDASVRGQAEVRDLDEFTRAMATERAVTTYADEIQEHQRTNTKSLNGVVFDAFKSRGGV